MSLKITEHGEHSAVVEYCRWKGYKLVGYPAQDYNKNRVKKMFKEGSVKGFPDLILLHIVDRYGALFIEMKVKPNKPTKEQIEVLCMLQNQGYATRVCYSAADAIETIERYLAGSFNLQKPA